MSDQSSSGWLIEQRGNDPANPRYYMIIKGVQQWTADEEKALRFARRCDVDAFVSGPEWEATPVYVAQYPRGDCG